MRTRHAAFTLIELMVSIALVVLLLVGINKVFRIATDTVGAGNAMSENTASNRSMQAVLYNDFQNSIIRSPDSPAFIIRSTWMPAFRDARDEQSDASYAALYASTPNPTPATVEAEIRTIDLDGNNSEADPGDNIPRRVLGRRNFRQDMMSFFTRYFYPRQTGNNGTFAADMQCNEAWIWYGHVRQPADANSLAGVNKNPGISPFAGTPVLSTENARTNPNNFYARQWGLGRVAMLLKPPVGGSILDKPAALGGTAQYHIGRPAGTTPDKLYPLAVNAPSTNGVTSDGFQLEHSRYDLAATSIDAFRKTLIDAINPAMGANSLWWSGGNMSPRFAAFPRPVKPLDSYGAARTAPWLVGGCTSFIVEYAGDFLHQVPATGAVDGDWTTPLLGTDGVIDYIVLPNGARTPRWYGFPRDVRSVTVAGQDQADGTITLQATPASLPATPDVVPLRDFLSASALVVMRAGDPPGAPFEHFVNTTMAKNSYNNSASPALNAEYVCAWQPNGTYINSTGILLGDPPKPRMIRVTMTVDDPNGRLPDGQSFEYVIQLP